MPDGVGSKNVHVRDVSRRTSVCNNRSASGRGLFPSLPCSPGVNEGSLRFLAAGIRQSDQRARDYQQKRARLWDDGGHGPIHGGVTTGESKPGRKRKGVGRIELRFGDLQDAKEGRTCRTDRGEGKGVAAAGCRPQAATVLKDLFSRPWS